VLVDEAGGGAPPATSLLAISLFKRSLPLSAPNVDITVAPLSPPLVLGWAVRFANVAAWATGEDGEEDDEEDGEEDDEEDGEVVVVGDDVEVSEVVGADDAAVLAASLDAEAL